MEMIRGKTVHGVNTCRNCGKEKTGLKVFCSPECRHEYDEKDGKTRGELTEAQFLRKWGLR